MSAVETLREAAKVLRERAGMTHAAHTQQVGEVAKVTYLLEWDGTPVAERSVMHPGVALALADWLDAEAQDQSHDPSEHDGSPSGHALRVAEAILGGAR